MKRFGIEHFHISIHCRALFVLQYVNSLGFTQLKHTFRYQNSQISLKINIILHPVEYSFRLNSVVSAICCCKFNGRRKKKLRCCALNSLLKLLPSKDQFKSIVLHQCLNDKKKSQTSKREVNSNHKRLKTHRNQRQRENNPWYAWHINFAINFGWWCSRLFNKWTNM